MGIISQKWQSTKSGSTLHQKPDYTIRETTQQFPQNNGGKTETIAVKIGQDLAKIRNVHVLPYCALSTFGPEQLFCYWSQTRTEKEPAQALQSNVYRMELLQRQARTGTPQNAKVSWVMVGGWMVALQLQLQAPGSG